MKKLILLALLITGVTNAQVGIGNTNPQEQLHVSKANDDINANVRIDGLSDVNPINNGTETNVVVDANGTLKLQDKSQNLVLIENDMLTTPTYLNSPSGNFVNSTIYTYTFTMPYDGLVNINSSVSAVFYLDNFLTPITDGQARLIGSTLLVDGVQQDRDREFYSNYGSDNTVVTGYSYLKNNKYIYLTQGTHTIELQVFVFGGGSLYVEFGGNNLDQMQIVRF